MYITSLLSGVKWDTIQQLHRYGQPKAEKVKEFAYWLDEYLLKCSQSLKLCYLDTLALV